MKETAQSLFEAFHKEATWAAASEEMREKWRHVAQVAETLFLAPPRAPGVLGQDVTDSPEVVHALYLKAKAAEGPNYTPDEAKAMGLIHGMADAMHGKAKAKHEDEEDTQPGGTPPKAKHKDEDEAHPKAHAKHKAHK